jgi:ATP-dependent DNA helicase RecQ
MSNDILCVLNLIPADVPSLSSRARRALIAYLLRWEHYEAAGRCLQQLLVTHSSSVTVYDELARLYLGLGQPDRALEMMRRRHALRVSNPSLALEARVHLAAGDMASAQAIADQMISDHPDLLLAWSLLADVRLAAGDLDGAEDTWRKREMLRPGVAPNAFGIARVWQARGDRNKAILWAQTALARADRDHRQPSMALLRFLETVLRAAGHDAQAKATTARLGRRQQHELEALHQALDLSPPAAESQQVGPPTRTPSSQSTDQPTATPGGQAAVQIPANVLAGAVDLTSEENTFLHGALHQHFDHEAFRPGQADVIAALLRGESVLTVMPTGAGKSLCYQLAALLLPGTALVISPLIALMKDQLDGLPTEVAGLSTTINSTLEGAEMETRLARAASGGYRLLYAAPERLRQRPFLHALKRAGISLLVVDEAHCVSLWGHDFRPDYRFIAKAWHELGKPPILTMTATATPRVRDDIQSGLGKMRLVAIDVHRSNLKLEARRFASDAEKQRSLLALCREIKGSGIVYAHSRAKCEQLAAMLRRNGLSAIHYHAGIQDRATAQDCFMSDQARIVVATIAFGMGVDKADVRFIIHYSPPKALENYYQEAGRAGRDGLPARCILFHAPGDQRRITHFLKQDALQLDFLRRVYAAIQRHVGMHGVGLVTVGDLERELVVDSTQLRVAIHFLETARLLWRGFDLPRTGSLALRRTPDDTDPDVVRFVESARLRIGQTVSRDLVAVCHDADLDPRAIEAKLLTWHDAGWLRYRGIGRDMLLALPEPPPDSEARVAAMLAEYHAGQEGRAAEMMAYATTSKCRHGHISAYFGGRPIERCQACDNCLGQSDAPPGHPGHKEVVASPLATEDLIAIILHGVARLPYPMGSTGLARALKGASSSSVQVDHFPLFGTLARWTQRSIRELISQLEDKGLLVAYKKENYRLLRLTTEGQKWLKAHPRDPAATIAPQPRDASETSASQARRQEEELTAHDSVLFERLRAWRLETAKGMNKPAFVVFSDKVLMRIATSCPTAEQELVQIRGIGPRKLEQYGVAVLDIVASYRKDPCRKQPCSAWPRQAPKASP